MTQVNLLQDLVLRLRELFAGYSLPNKSGLLQEVRVFAQYMPQPEGLTLATKSEAGLKGYADSDFESNFPCVIVKLGDQTDSEELGNDGTVVNVKLLCGVYDDSKDSQGYVDVLSMQELIREYLLEHRIVAEKYLLLMPLVSKLVESDTWPVYFGEQSLRYVVARPVMGSEWIQGRRYSPRECS